VHWQWVGDNGQDMSLQLCWVNELEEFSSGCLAVVYYSYTINMGILYNNLLAKVHLSVLWMCSNPWDMYLDASGCIHGSPYCYEVVGSNGLVKGRIYQSE